MSTTEIPNLGSIISTAIADLMTPEFIEKQVTSRAEKLVIDAVDSALRSYSPTRKVIEDAIQEALKVDKLDLPSYGASIQKILQVQINTIVSDLVAGQLSKDMAEILSLAPKEIKLSEIAEGMMGRRLEQDHDHGDLITCHVEHSDRGYLKIYLDESEHHEDPSRKSVDAVIHLNKEGVIYHGYLREKDIKKGTWIGSFYGLEQLIRSYVACGTKIIVDEDEVSTYHDYD